MLKQTLQAPPEKGTIATYTGELSRFLRGSVPGERADEIIQEAHAHLLDRADAIAQKENVSQAQAEAQAVAAFTPAMQFAREMAQSAYETGYSKTWYAVGGVITALMLDGHVGGLVANGLQNSLGYYGASISRLSFIAIVGSFALLPLAALCAFQARRVQTHSLLRRTTLIATFVFLYVGFFYTDSVRSGKGWDETQGLRSAVQAGYDGLRDERLQVENDVLRLNVGLHTYQAKNTVIPTQLKAPNGHGYLVQNTIWPNMILADTGLKDSTYYYPFQFSEDQQETVPTLAEARRRWLTSGPRWLTQAHYENGVFRHREEVLRITFYLAANGFCPNGGVVVHDKHRSVWRIYDFTRRVVF